MTRPPRSRPDLDAEWANGDALDEVAASELLQHQQEDERAESNTADPLTRIRIRMQCGEELPTLRTHRRSQYLT